MVKAAGPLGLFTRTSVSSPFTGYVRNVPDTAPNSFHALLQLTTGRQTRGVVSTWPKRPQGFQPRGVSRERNANPRPRKTFSEDSENSQCEAVSFGIVRLDPACGGVRGHLTRTRRSPWGRFFPPSGPASPSSSAWASATPHAHCPLRHRWSPGGLGSCRSQQKAPQRRLPEKCADEPGKNDVAGLLFLGLKGASCVVLVSTSHFAGQRRTNPGQVRGGRPVPSRDANGRVRADPTRCRPVLASGGRSGGESRDRECVVHVPTEPPETRAAR